MNPEKRLRKHQVDAVVHVLYGENTPLARCVGAGKPMRWRPRNGGQASRTVRQKHLLFYVLAQKFLVGGLNLGAVKK